MLRLFAVRPFLGTVILGIPVLLLIAVGLLTIMIVKFLVIFVLPAVLVIWLFRRIVRGRPRPDAADGPATA